MDWQQRTLQWLQRPQSIALLVVVIITVGLIAFQANQLTQKAPQMCELISQCQLRHGDLQRIQVALGESGLDDFKIDGQKLLVPQHRHSEYLKAVSERDALPMDLRDDRSDSISNPLLSRSQQQALKSQRKKRQLKEMILRLPFVQQAWLEIDTAPSSSPFVAARQSAVISIQPAGDQPLDAQHVDTIRRMIGGAVASLQPDQIEVIDLGEGFAYDRAGTSQLKFEVTSVQQRRAREKQLEDQIKVALNRFAGVGVKVQLMACPRSMAPKTETNVANHRTAPPLEAGSNGVASIFDSETKSPTQGVSSTTVPAIQASHVQPVQNLGLGQDETPVCRVAVQVDVPESALANVASSLMLLRPSEGPNPPATDRAEQKFGAIRPQIEREVASVLPAAWLTASGVNPVEVTLRRSSATVVPGQKDQLAKLFQKYWPSVATLCVGVLLLSLVVRKSSGRQSDYVDPNILSMSQHRDLNPAVEKNAKENINRMFTEDPDGAARAVEGWIRNAG